VVVTVGETATDPYSACDPIPLSMETEVAFVVVQESVEECPAGTVEGVAAKVIAGSGTDPVTCGELRIS